MELPLREQGTLLTGVRGCDLAPKPGDPVHFMPERSLVGFLRWCVMNPHDPREVDILGAFFQSAPPANSTWKPSQFGHYPQHWYSHLMHCFEVVGYRHPDENTRRVAYSIYVRFVDNMHLRPEPFDAMVNRLGEDRIASGEVVS